MTKENPILLFDGVCNLCNGAVDFVIKRDAKKQFLFVALQSELGKRLIAKYKISSDIDSVILITKNSVYLESDAAIEIARLLPFPWNWVTGFKVVPLKLRNGTYKWIARNRFRWFGKRETCRML
jgi:predicted DCC family thiol-disulfide oxidoreductase YuxK